MVPGCQDRRRMPSLYSRPCAHPPPDGIRRKASDKRAEADGNRPTTRSPSIPGMHYPRPCQSMLVPGRPFQQHYPTYPTESDGCATNADGLGIWSLSSWLWSFGLGHFLSNTPPRPASTNPFREPPSGPSTISHLAEQCLISIPFPPPANPLRNRRSPQPARLLHKPAHPRNHFLTMFLSFLIGDRASSMYKLKLLVKCPAEKQTHSATDNT